MATVRFTGNAPAIKQINTITPASVTVGNVFTVTINGKAISFTATAATVANVTAGLVAAIQASDFAEFKDVTPTDNTTTLTLTATTAGVPFTQTSGAATGTGTPGCTLVTSTTTANSGPYNWDIASNWDTLAVPVAADDVYIDRPAAEIRYGLDQSAVTLSSLTIRCGQGYTVKIGLPDTNSQGYPEYRGTDLKISATTVSIEDSALPGGSLRLNLNTGTAQTTGTMDCQARAVDSEREAVFWVGTHASNAWTVTNGSFAAAGRVGETATIATLNTARQGDTGQGPTVRLGSGCTLTTIHHDGGSLEANSAITTYQQKGDAKATINGTGTLGDVTVDGGSLIVNTSGTVGTSFAVGPKGRVDYSQDPRAKTITPMVVLSPGAKWNDPNGVVTYTAGIQLYRCSLRDVTLDVGPNRTLSVA